MTNSLRTRFEATFALGGGVALLGLVLVGSGCGVGDVPASGANANSSVEVLAASEGLEAEVPAGGAEGGGADSGATQYGSLTGTITLTGSKPNLPLPTIQDQTVCKPDKVGNEAIVVGPEGGIANVFVYIAKPKSRPPADAAKPESAEPRVLLFDNVNCRFEPHAMVVTEGETITVRNSDAVLHNTHTLPKRNDVFNKSLTMGQEESLSYSKSELVPVKCDVHAWMNAYHLVVKFPEYADVTGPDGKFTLTGLPYGPNEITIVHEGREQTFEVVIGAPEQEKNFSFSAGDLGVAQRVKTSTEILVTSFGQ